ncbi:MAG: hypothetical protein ACRBI6_01165 [Acidimicrobiales bacterium]
MAAIHHDTRRAGDASVSDDDAMKAEEVSAVYRALVRRFHPDWRALAGRATPEGGASMYRLWEAHQTLTSSMLPMVRPASAAEPIVERSLDRLRPPNENECLFCGFTPAEPARFRHQEAGFLDRVMVPFEGTMCRSCAQAVGRRKQAQTVQTGWWGVRAPFANVVVMTANAAELRRVKRQPPPEERADNVISLLRAPMATYAEVENPRGLTD